LRQQRTLVLPIGVGGKQAGVVGGQTAEDDVRAVGGAGFGRYGDD